MSGQRNRNRELALAYHEAAHAVACVHERVPLRSVTIQPDADSEGKASVHHALGGIDPYFDIDSENGRLRVERYVRVSLAGGIAQHFYWKNSVRGDFDDVSKANQLLAKIVGSDEELRAYITLLKIQTRQLVRNLWWAEIRAVAKALVAERHLSARRVRDIIASVP
jgi:hypothetical protein